MKLRAKSDVHKIGFQFQADVRVKYEQDFIGEKIAWEGKNLDSLKLAVSLKDIQ